jgi:DNA polymerase-3 subunit beta
MQLVKTHRDTLLRPLQVVSGIVERRHTLPILANILIRKDGERVSFLSTDIEVQITTHANVGSGSDIAATTVAARKLLDILRALPDGDDVALSLANKRMTVQSGKSRFALQTLAAEEFPTVAQAEQYSATVTLPQKTLKHLFNMVHFAMAQQDIRYYLNGLLLVVDGKNVIAVATDGHRLAFCQVEVDQEFPRQEVIIPRKTIIELQRLLEESDETVQLDIASNQVRLTFADIELVSKLVEGKFPDYTRVVPKGYKNDFTIDRDRVISPGSMKISSTNADQEEAVDELEIDYGGDSIDIGFNVSYLLDVLNNLKCDNVNIALGDANSSALITIPDNADFKYVVMPMRI